MELNFKATFTAGDEQVLAFAKFLGYQGDKLDEASDFICVMGNDYIARWLNQVNAINIKNQASVQIQQSLDAIQQDLEVTFD